jgi:hypothetical protein
VVLGLVSEEVQTASQAEFIMKGESEGYRYDIFIDYILYAIS